MRTQKYITFPKKTFIQKYTKDKKYRKVRDHCHYEGKYKGAAGRLCNLKYECI